MKLRLAPVLLLLALAGCGSEKTSSIPSGNGSGTTTATAAATTPATTSTQPTAKAPAGCTSVRQVAPKPDGKLKKPTTKLDQSKTWTATVKTNCGTFAFKLDPKNAPNASASIAYLAGKKFYDRTVFHRIVPGFVIQGGDPTATGSGGPGYLTVDKPPKTARYVRGVVAMAKTQTQAAGTSGSQFFVVTAPDAHLPPDYAILGKVVSGIAVVNRIGKLGDANEQPTRVVEIERATLAES
jgi:cyclophilin family peptidyl-prolyl cis-trans isomerase